MAFQGYLKQSTAVDILLGPFLDETDGKTAETGLTIEDEHVLLSKNGQALAAKNDANDAAHDAVGYHNCPLDATDTNTVGQLTITAHLSGALPVRFDYHIVEEAVYDAMYGASSEGPLQATTAGRTLDILSTGEAAANVTHWTGNAAAATSQDGVPEVDVTYWTGTAATLSSGSAKPEVDIASVHDDATAAGNLESACDNYSATRGLSGTALPAVAAGGAGGVPTDATGSTDLINDIWDEVLTGGTHNVSNSAGRRIRQMQETGGYNGSIWVDTVNGSSGTTDFENGTDTNPVDTIGDANTLASSLGISRFKIAPGSTITLAATQANQIFDGSSWTLALGGQSIDGSTFYGATVSGIATNTSDDQYFYNCTMGAVTLPEGTHVIQCEISGTQTIGEAGDFFYDGCYSAVAGSSTPAFDFGSALNSSNLSFRHYSGGIEIQNMGAGTGTYSMSLEGMGQLVINANCSATSNASIRGLFTVTDNAGGAVTVTETARYDTLLINAECDTALSDYDPPTNTEMEARTPTAAQLAYIVANAATGVPVTFTTSGGSTTAAVLNQVDSAGADSTDDQYNGRLLVFSDGTLKDVVTDITDYDGGTVTATITAIPVAPTSSHNARLI